MRHRFPSHKLLFPADFKLSPSPRSSALPPTKEPQSVYDAWLASRELPGQPGHYLVPGAPRRLTLENTRLALYITQTCALDFVSSRQLPVHFRLFMAVHVAQGAVRPQPLQNSSHDVPKCRSKHFPCFPWLLSGLSQHCALPNTLFNTRSQALIVDEVCSHREAPRSFLIHFCVSNSFRL